MGRMKKKPLDSVHAAAVALGSVKSPRKARSSRKNGLKGGRPSSGFLPERSMLRVVKQVADDLGLDSRACRTLRQCAVEVRRAAIRDRLSLDDAAHSLAFHPATLFHAPVQGQNVRPALWQAKRILSGALL